MIENENVAAQLAHLQAEVRRLSALVDPARSTDGISDDPDPRTDRRRLLKGAGAAVAGAAAGVVASASPAAAADAPDSATYVTMSDETSTLLNSKELGSGVIMKGTTRPPAATAGRLFVDSDDDGGTLLRDSGSSWEQVAPGLSEDVTRTGDSMTGTLEFSISSSGTAVKVVPTGQPGGATHSSLEVSGDGRVVLGEYGYAPNLTIFGGSHYHAALVATAHPLTATNQMVAVEMFSSSNLGCLFIGYSHGGSVASPSATINDQLVLALLAKGFYSDPGNGVPPTYPECGRIDFWTTQAFSQTGTGTKIMFRLVATNETTMTDVAQMDGSGITLKRGAMHEKVTTVTSSGSALTIDLDHATNGGSMFDVKLTANCTLTFTGSVAGAGSRFTLLLRQDATGSRLVTWPSVKWAAGTAPALSTAANKVDILNFVTNDGGTTWYGQLVGTGFA